MDYESNVIFSVRYVLAQPVKEKFEAADNTVEKLKILFAAMDAVDDDKALGIRFSGIVNEDKTVEPTFNEKLLKNFYAIRNLVINEAKGVQQTEKAEQTQAKTEQTAEKNEEKGNRRILETAFQNLCLKSDT